MTVSELIAALSACDPNAKVITSTRCDFDDGSEYLSGFDQTVNGLEVGFSDSDIDWDVSFSANKEGYRTVPTVRLYGYLDAKALHPETP